jgi:hypothetical protein
MTTDESFCCSLGDDYCIRNRAYIFAFSESYGLCKMSDNVLTLQDLIKDAPLFSQFVTNDAPLVEGLIRISTTLSHKFFIIKEIPLRGKNLNHFIMTAGRQNPSVQLDVKLTLLGNSKSVENELKTKQFLMTDIHLSKTLNSNSRFQVFLSKILNNESTMGLNELLKLKLNFVRNDLEIDFFNDLAFDMLSCYRIVDFGEESREMYKKRCVKKNNYLTYDKIDRMELERARHLLSEFKDNVSKTNPFSLGKGAHKIFIKEMMNTIENLYVISEKRATSDVLEWSTRINKSPDVSNKKQKVNEGEYKVKYHQAIDKKDDDHQRKITSDEKLKLRNKNIDDEINDIKRKLDEKFMEHDKAKKDLLSSFLNNARFEAAKENKNVEEMKRINALAKKKLEELDLTRSKELNELSEMLAKKKLEKEVLDEEVKKEMNIFEDLAKMFKESGTVIENEKLSEIKQIDKKDYWIEENYSDEDDYFDQFDGEIFYPDKASWVIDHQNEIKMKEDAIEKERLEKIAKDDLHFDLKQREIDELATLINNKKKRPYSEHKKLQQKLYELKNSYISMFQRAQVDSLIDMMEKM